MNRIVLYLSFCDRFISFSRKSSRFIFCCSMNLCIYVSEFLLRQIMFHCLYISYSVHSFVDRNLRCLHLLAIVNKAAMNINVQTYLFESLLFSLFWYIPRSGSASACVLSCFSCVWLFVTVWTVAHQDPLSMGFFRQGYWSELPCPPPGIFPTQGLNPHLLYHLVGRWVLYH